MLADGVAILETHLSHLIVIVHMAEWMESVRGQQLTTTTNIQDEQLGNTLYISP